MPKFNQKGIAHILFILILLAGIGIAVYLTQFTQVFKPRAANDQSPAQDPGTLAKDFFEMVDAKGKDAAGLDTTYSYAPEILKTADGKYHAFFCSGGPPGYDYMKYSSSGDGQTWSVPVTKVKSEVRYDPTGKIHNMAACDPSVVYFKGPVDSQTYFYMFYTNRSSIGGGRIYDVNNPSALALIINNSSQDTINVARSATIDGDYAVYTNTGNWRSGLNVPGEEWPMDLVTPFQVRDQVSSGLGAGQSSVVVGNDGQLWMWYNDDSHDPASWYNYADKEAQWTYLIKSNNPISWTKCQTCKTNVKRAHSFVAKMDPATNGYVAVQILNPEPERDSELAYLRSQDGITWTAPTVVIGTAGFPHYAHNVGLSSDILGRITSGLSLISFGAPVDFTQLYRSALGTPPNCNNEPVMNAARACAPHWDLVGVLLTGAQLGGSTTPPPSVAPPVAPRSAVNNFNIPRTDFHLYAILDTPPPGGWEKVGPAFYAYSTPQTGTLAVNHFYQERTSGGVHLYAITDNVPGWKNYGPAFYAYSTPQTGTVAVNRFYLEKSTGGVDYYAVLDNAPPGGWVKIGPAFYAFPGP